MYDLRHGFLDNEFMITPKHRILSFFFFFCCCLLKKNKHFSYEMYFDCETSGYKPW